MNLLLRFKIRFSFKPLFSMLLAAMLLLSIAWPVTAQSNSGVFLLPLDLSTYPHIGIFFRVINADGVFVKDVMPGDIRVMENNQVLGVDTLELLSQGTRLMVAMNEGPTLANRYSGVSRFDHIKDTLRNWTQSQSNVTLNEFSLVSNQGVLSTQDPNPENWLNVISDYQPDLLASRPGLSSLSTAVDMASSPIETSIKTPLVLFITPLPAPEQMAGIKEIINRAVQTNVRIVIWLIGPPDYASAENGLLLKKYAEETGGSYLVYSGSETLPEINTYLEPLSNIYKLTYKTAIKTSGEHSILVKLSQKSLSLESAPVSFSLTVSPPNPIFLSPPATITRFWTETKKISESVLMPDSQTIQTMIEFPDGKTRDLAYSRLFVNGKLVAERTTEPFDQFQWDISGYTLSGSYSLQVVIEDTVGLKGETIEIPVDLQIQEHPKNWWQKLTAGINLVNGIIGGVLLVVILGGIFIAIRSLARKQKIRRKNSSPAEDPLTQVVEIDGAIVSAPSPLEYKEEWPRIHGVGLAPARLVRKADGEKTTPQVGEIPLSGQEISIGSDRRKADVVLSHPSVSALHSHIFKDANADFRVADAGSASGTWVNYAPVSSRGARLEHGDLVQFGRLIYRFEIHEASPKKISVTPYNQDT